MKFYIERFLVERSAHYRTASEIAISIKS